VLLRTGIDGSGFEHRHDGVVGVREHDHAHHGAHRHDLEPALPGAHADPPARPGSAESRKEPGPHRTRGPSHEHPPDPGENGQLDGAYLPAGTTVVAEAVTTLVVGPAAPAPQPVSRPESQPYAEYERLLPQSPRGPPA
jgi:hypothetical protein